MKKAWKSKEKARKSNEKAGKSKEKAMKTQERHWKVKKRLRKVRKIFGKVKCVERLIDKFVQIGFIVSKVKVQTETKKHLLAATYKVPSYP